MTRGQRPLAIEALGLVKRFGTRTVLHTIDLTVRCGEVFALLGPNGAGKTTTLEILEGHQQASGGEVTVLGFDPATGGPEFRRKIGVVHQETVVERFLTVEEIIDQFRSFYDHPRALEEVLDIVQLADQRTQRVGRLSLGQQRRVDVALGLVGDPDLLFLDEPTTGFDPLARRSAWTMIESLKALGKTVLLTTHYMEEAQALADRVAILVEGEIVSTGSPRMLARRARMPTEISFRLPENAPTPPLARARSERWAMETREPTSALRALTMWAVDNGIELEELAVSPPSLDDLYVRYARRKSR